jgi:PKD repeat protein
VQRLRYRATKPHRQLRRRLGCLHPRRRFALVAASLLMLFGAGATPALADQAVTALVYGAGNSTPVQDTTTIGQLESGCPTYTGPEIRFYEPGGVPGVAQSLNYSATWTLATVLSCLPKPIPLASVTGITVIGSAGPELTGPPEDSQLSPADLGTPSDFADPQQAPLISSQGSGIVYDRPWRGGADSNAEDQVFDASPAPFDFEVFQGPLLTVTAQASATSVPAATTVTFSALVNGAPAGSQLSYSWKFDGAATDSTQPSPSVMIDTPGSYKVTVQVTDGGGGGGGATIPITVTGPGSQTTTQPAPTHTGPRNSGGREPRHRAGHSRARSSGRSGNRRSGGSTGASTSRPAGAGTTGSASGSSPAPVTGSSAAPVTGSGSAVATEPSGGAQTTGSHSSRHLGAPWRVHERGVVVEGTLVSDVVPISERRSSLVRALSAPPASASAAALSSPSSTAAAIAAALAVVALLGLGAGAEWRRSRGESPRSKWPEGSS